MREEKKKLCSNFLIIATLIPIRNLYTPDSKSNYQPRSDFESLIHLRFFQWHFVIEATFVISYLDNYNSKTGPDEVMSFSRERRSSDDHEMNLTSQESSQFVENDFITNRSAYKHNWV